MQKSGQSLTPIYDQIEVKGTRQVQLLNQIAAEQQKTQLVIQEQFRQRDELQAKQQQDYETQAWVRKVNDAFETEFAEVVKAVPALKSDPAFREVVYTNWIGGVQRNQAVPVAVAAKPYLDVIRAQNVATQAAQPTRAEVHSQMVRTTGGGSGASVAPAAPLTRTPGRGIAGDIAAYRRQVAAANR